MARVVRRRGRAVTRSVVACLLLGVAALGQTTNGGVEPDDEHRALVAQEGEVAPVVIPLDGAWELLLDPEDRGLHERLAERPDHPVWDDALEVAVPGVLEQRPETAGYDGIAWYRRALPPVPVADAFPRVVLRFENVNYRADVWVAGRHLVRHDGADAPFEIDLSGLSELLAGAAPDAAAPVWLVVRCVDPGRRPVEGLLLGALPHAKEDWYLNYGGIVGPVRIEQSSPVRWVAHDVSWQPAAGRAEVRLTLDNLHGVPRRGRLDVTVAGRGPPGPETSPAVTLPPGRSVHRLAFGTHGLAAWSPDDPVRHELVVSWSDEEQPGAPPTCWRLPFGLRTFDVAGDRFALNGEPVYLRGVLYQPYFPGTHAHPPSASFQRAELEAIKAAGFNLVRAHLRTDPALYALCDEIGLLVHAEPTLGWLTEVAPHTADAVDAALVAFAHGVSGHPSVVMAGVLNELSGRLHERGAELHRRVHELLPGHLVLDDSGSWQGASAYFAPFADEPVPYDDLHVYRSWPWNAGDLRFVDEIGAGHDGLVYVSEYGFGGVPSLRANAEGFGARVHLDDARLHRAQLDDVERQIAAGIATDLAGDVETLVALGQANQARAARSMAATLRAQPRVAGDVYTQWRDACWEDGAGLVDVWGHPKPALAALAELNGAPADRVAPLGPPGDAGPAGAGPGAPGDGDQLAPAADAGAPLVARFEAIDLAPEWTAERLPVDAARVLDALDALRAMPPDERAAAVAAWSAQSPGDAGDASERQTDTEGATEGEDRDGDEDTDGAVDGTVDGTVDGAARAARRVAARHALHAGGADGGFAAAVAELESYPPIAIVGFRANMWGPDGIGTTLSLLRWVRDGGTALLVEPPTAGRPLRQDMFGYDTYGAVADLPFDARVRTARGHFVGVSLVFRPDSPLLDGLHGSRLLDERLAPVRPDQALLVQGVDGVELHLGCFDGYGLFQGGIVQIVPFGRGHLVLSTLRLDPEQIGAAGDGGAPSPTARTWRALVELTTSVARRGAWPTPRAPVEVPAALAERIGRLVWRHKIYFGLAERLAWQVVNGRRPVRRELDDLPAVVERKNRALLALVDGRLEHGAALLEELEPAALGGDRDAFLRAEIALAERYAELSERPPLPVRLRIGELHAQALETMRDGDLDRARHLLDEAGSIVAGLVPETH